MTEDCQFQMALNLIFKCVRMGRFMCTLQIVYKEISILKLLNEIFHDVSQRYFANSLREILF